MVADLDVVEARGIVAERAVVIEDERGLAGRERLRRNRDATMPVLSTWVQVAAMVLPPTMATASLTFEVAAMHVGRLRRGWFSVMSISSWPEKRRLIGQDREVEPIGDRRGRVGQLALWRIRRRR